MYDLLSVGFDPNMFEEAAALVPPKMPAGFGGAADTVAPPKIDVEATQKMNNRTKNGKFETTFLEYVHSIHTTGHVWLANAEPLE